MRAAVSSESVLLMRLVVVGSGYYCSGVLSGEEGIDIPLALGADARLDLDDAFALGAKLDALRVPVRGVGNAVAGFNCEYTGNAPC